MEVDELFFENFEDALINLSTAKITSFKDCEGFWYSLIINRWFELNGFLIGYY